MQLLGQATCTPLPTRDGSRAARRAKRKLAGPSLACVVGKAHCPCKEDGRLLPQLGTEHEVW